MKRIKAINGYTIYETTKRDEKDGYNSGEYVIYFSSDIRDYGREFSYPEFDGIDTLENAEEYCSGNYAIAREIVEGRTTCATFEEIEEVEKKLDSRTSVAEIEEDNEEEYYIEEVKNEYQSINISGYFGKWSAFEKCFINGRNFYIMEHDYYGDMTQYVVIEVKNNLIVNTLDTYDDIITCLQDEEII